MEKKKAVATAGTMSSSSLSLTCNNRSLSFLAGGACCCRSAHVFFFGRGTGKGASSSRPQILSSISRTVKSKNEIFPTKFVCFLSGFFLLSPLFTSVSTPASLPFPLPRSPSSPLRVPWPKERPPHRSRRPPLRPLRPPQQRLTLLLRKRLLLLLGARCSLASFGVDANPRPPPLLPRPP